MKKHCDIISQVNMHVLCLPDGAALLVRLPVLSNTEVKRYCTPDPEAVRLLNTAVDTLKLSMRAYQRILKVARTIADLEGADTVASVHVAEAIQYRELDQKYWR